VHARHSQHKSLRDGQGTHSLGDTLGDDGNALDLRELEQLHCGLVYGARRGEVDDRVDIGVLGNGLVYVLVDGQKRLAGSPVPASRCQPCSCIGGRWGLARTFCSRTGRRMCR
jgi:hypothetical protein